jgi:hypothetical protein
MKGVEKYEKNRKLFNEKEWAVECSYGYGRYIYCIVKVRMLFLHLSPATFPGGITRY